MFKFLYLFLTTSLGMNFILVVGFVYERKVMYILKDIQGQTLSCYLKPGYNYHSIMIIIIYLVFFVIAAVGIGLLVNFTNEKNPYIFLPAGMILGVSLYIFLLNIISKLLPGQTGILVSTFIFLTIGLLSSMHHPLKAIRIKPKNLTNFLLLSALIILVVYFTRLKMTSIFPSADADMQWAYAASFARGNYPVKTPWQPDLDPNYHLGAYFLEGAITSLTKLPLITVHTLLNTYYLIAGSLFALLIFWENESTHDLTVGVSSLDRTSSDTEKPSTLESGFYRDKHSLKNLWLVLAILIFYTAFGVIIIAFPAQNLFNIHPGDILDLLIKLPANIPAKGTAGASLVDLNSLSFLPARSLSIGLAFLTLYLSFVTFKYPNFKILFLSLIFSVTALVEESIFLPMFLTLILVFTASLFSFIPKLNFLKPHRQRIFLTILITTLAIILQGGFITELLNQKGATYNIYLPFSNTFMEQLKTTGISVLPSTSKMFNFFLPGPLLLALIILVYSLSKNKKLSLIALFSIIALFCYCIIENKYYPSNNIRLYNFSYIAAGTGLIYSIYLSMKNKSLVVNILVFSTVALLLSPSLIPEILNQVNQIKIARLNNIRSQVLIADQPQTPFEQISTWAIQNLPKNSKLISIDSEQPSPHRSIQFEYKGIYTLLGPQDIHTGRPEPGPEFFDLSLALNPSLFKQTKTEYVYIESDSKAYQQLPQFRKNDLNNSKYFQIIRAIKTQDNNNQLTTFTLYKVMQAFLDPNNSTWEITEGTLAKLQSLIPKNATVYVSDYGESSLDFWYRMAVIFSMKDKQLKRNPTLTDYMYIETKINYQSALTNQSYDYYILAPNTKPTFNASLIWSNIYARAWKRI